MLSRQRIRNAWRAIKGSQPIISSTVRPYEENKYRTRDQYDAALAVAHYVKWVKVAVSRRSSALASCPLRVYTAGKGTEAERVWRTRRLSAPAQAALAKRAVAAGAMEEVTDELHPLVSLLRNVNPMMNGFELVEQSESYLALAGNAYWAMVMGPNRWPSELWLLPPQYTRPIPSKKGMISGYIYGRGMEIEQEFKAEDIIHFKRPNPYGNPYLGLGDLAACVDDADLSVLMTKFGLATLENGAQPGAIVTPKVGTITKEQALELTNAINREYQGVEKAGKTVVLTGAIDFNRMGLTEKELAFVLSQDKVQEAIANCFDMPVSLLRLESAALATAQAAMPIWQRMALKPSATRMQDQINARLTPIFREALGDPTLCVCFDDIVDEDRAALTLQETSKFSAGITTKNEARAAFNLPPVDGGDEFKAAPDPLGIGGIGGEDAPKDEDEKEDEEDDDEPVRIVRKFLPLPAPKVVVRYSDLILGASACCDACRAGPFDIDEVYELQLYQGVQQWYQDVADKVKYEGDLSTVKVNTSQSRRKFEEYTENAIRALFDRGMKAGAADVLPVVGDFFVKNIPAEKYLSTYRFRLSGSVAMATEERMRAAILSTIEQGGTIDDAAQAMREVVDGLSTTGAERIARTETSRAYMGGREAAWKESGVVRGKEWLLSADPCPLCEAASELFKGRIVPVGVPFLAQNSTITGTDGKVYLMDYADVDGPPIHPNDRCSMGAVFEEGI